ncbi:hypothetical protein BH11BAC5_BH11BAC5_05760 [soil metagenome]
MKAIFLIFLIVSSGSLKAQPISINTDKGVYKSNDSVEIKIVNNLVDFVYVIALELNVNNKWGELESDINMMGNKVEILKPLKKNQIFVIKIILSDYLTRTLTRDKNKFRLRLSYGQGNKETSEIYSNTFKLYQ